MRIRLDHTRTAIKEKGSGQERTTLLPFSAWRVVSLVLLTRMGRPTVVADHWIVRPQSSDELDLDPNDLASGGVGGFPEDLLAHGEVPPLLRGEVLLDQLAVCTAEVGQGVGHVGADVDLAVRIGDLVDRRHGFSVSTQAATFRSLSGGRRAFGGLE